MRARALIAAPFAAALAAGALVVVAAASAACTSSSGGGGAADAGTAPCPNDLPASCPTPTPSYSATVAAIIQDRCNGCHANGGPGQSTEDFSTYDQIHSRRGPMLTQVYSCLMPPPDAGQPTPAERAALLGWLVCEAPDN